MKSIINSLKKVVSFGTNKPIEIGIGVSTDDNVQLPVSTDVEKLEEVAQENIRAYGRFYKLQHTLGLFELVGLVKSDEKTLYKIRNIKTGEEVQLDVKTVEFLFEKV